MSNSTEVSKNTRAQEDDALVPPVDVIEDSTGITLYADLPGLKKEKLNMQVEANTLTIEGEVDIRTPENMNASHVEVTLPRYKRVFTLSKELDCDKISAEFRQGVLKLRIPKSDYAQPRKIPIHVA